MQAVMKHGISSNTFAPAIMYRQFQGSEQITERLQCGDRLAKCAKLSFIHGIEVSMRYLATKANCMAQMINHVIRKD